MFDTLTLCYIVPPVQELVYVEHRPYEGGNVTIPSFPPF